MCIEKELSDKSKYPTFARIAVTGSELASIMHELLSYYKRKKTSVIWQDLFPHNKLYDEFHGSHERKIVSVYQLKAHYNLSKHHNLTLGYLKEISSKSKRKFSFCCCCFWFFCLFCLFWPNLVHNLSASDCISQFYVRCKYDSFELFSTS